MTESWSHQPVGDADPDAGTGAAPDRVEEHEHGAVLDELAALDQLEADLSAVEQAVASLERVAGEGHADGDVVAEIAAAVPADRFGSAPD